MSKAYRLSWIITYLLLQITRLAIGISAFFIVAGEFTFKYTFFQGLAIKLGAMAIGFIGVTVTNRIIKAVEHYCHEYDI